MKRLLHIIFLLGLTIFFAAPAVSQTDSVVCTGDEAVYAVNSTYSYNSIFQWEVEGGSFIDSLGSEVRVRWHEDTDEGVISVKEISAITGSDTYCEGETQRYVVDVRSTFADLGMDQEICEGSSIEFSPGTGYESYMWQDSSQQSYYTADSSGLIWVQVTDQYGCQDRDSVELTVHDNPDVDIQVSTMYPDKVQITDDSVSFAAGEVEYVTLDAGMWSSYEWNTGEMMSTIDVEDSDVGTAEAGKQSRNYWVSVTNEFGCSARDSITVSVYGKLRIPNAFTPGGDQVNDKWKIPALSLYPNCVVQVFDRHGEMVFRSNGYESGDYWDGTDRNGHKLPMDSYYYIIKLGNGEKPIYGSVTIIR